MWYLKRREGGREGTEGVRREGGILVGLNTNTDVAVNNELLIIIIGTYSVAFSARSSISFISA